MIVKEADSCLHTQVYDCEDIVFEHADVITPTGKSLVADVSFRVDGSGGNHLLVTGKLTVTQRI